MRDFRVAAHAVMSNARCLTEGVDVPPWTWLRSFRRGAVVWTSFRPPTRYATLARQDERVCACAAYVELAAGETIEAAVNRAEFDEVWDVLQSMQEQDDVLAELIRYAGEQKGRGRDSTTAD